jgi:hypothetical protein
MPDIDWCPPPLDRQLDDADGAINTGAEPARRGDH